MQLQPILPISILAGNLRLQMLLLAHSMAFSTLLTAQQQVLWIQAFSQRPHQLTSQGQEPMTRRTPWHQGSTPFSLWQRNRPSTFSAARWLIPFRVMPLLSRIQLALQLNNLGLLQIQQVMEMLNKCSSYQSTLHLTQVALSILMMLVAALVVS